MIAFIKPNERTYKKPLHKALARVLESEQFNAILPLNSGNTPKYLDRAEQSCKAET
jgi:hypothetical protein